MEFKKIPQYLHRAVTDRKSRFLYLSSLGLFNWLSDEKYLKLRYKAELGKNLNLENPQTFNEKLQWLKLHNRKPEYTMMVDKYKVRQYIADTIGEQYLIPLLGVWDDPDEIDFESLPDQFVLKCNHNSGTGMCICKDKSKLDIKEVRKGLKRGLAENYYLLGREWPYKDVPRKVIAEKYMEDSETSELRDYKFFCFGGIAKCYKVNFDKFVQVHGNYFTPYGNMMKLGDEDSPPDFNRVIAAPSNLKKMRELSEILSKSHPFLRTDFYDVDGKVYFGELTFYHDAGFCNFLYEGNDELLGSWLKLPESAGGGYCLIYKDLLCLLSFSKEKGRGLRDYKFYCFDGCVKFVMINSDRNTEEPTKADYFDRNFNWLDFTWGYRHADVRPTKPRRYDDMIEVAEKLSRGLPHVRVDLYECNGRIYFGELTFYDGSGFEAFDPIDWDYGIGGMLKLSKE